MSSSSSSVFDTLPTRPPTPPRDTASAIEDAITFLNDGHEVDRALQQKATLKESATVPSPHSPPGSQETTESTSTAKRVGFTPNPTYHPIARVGQVSSSSPQLRKTRPSAKDVKPLRSILKQATQPPPLTPDDLESAVSYFSPHEPGSFARMLQSAITQLAGSSVAARLDAYLALNGALRTYENVPDAEALVAKMTLLMQFLTRDMAWKNTRGTLDTNIVTQAIKLTSTIMYDRRLAAALDDDFRSFVIDRSIAVIEHADMPKAVMKNHMMLLAQQRFSAKSMTPGQADRTITTLATVDDRCSGNTVIGTRLVIYQRLLEQAPAVMLQRMRDWFEQVVHGMLSSIKDIRIRAIEICTVAGLTLGNQPHASKTVLDLFQSEVEDGQTFGDYLDLRLTQMITEKDVEAGAYVPQIWSAVVLFFRNKRFPVEKWTKFKVWLKLIQRCLNASDLTIRHHAHLAWNRLVFVVMPDASTTRSLLSMLKIPVTSGLDRRATDEHTKQARQFALDTFYNLLHYSLRPGLSHEELDVAWDTFVDPVLSGMVKSNSYGRQLACGIIRGLCSTNSGIWNVNAANEPEAMQSEDLPRLDPKWVRSRFAKVLKPMQTVLTNAITTSEGGSTYGATWRALMQSVADAGGQEIKTSNDLKEAIALVVGLCRTLWQASPEPAAGTTVAVFTQRYASIITTTVGCIGAGPFAEDFLTKTRDDGLQVASTPSHRPSKHHSTPHSPFVFLFGLLYQPPTWMQQSEAFAVLASALLELQTSSRPSATAKVETLARSSQTWSAGYASGAESLVAARLWQCLAKEAKSILETPSKIDDNSESQSLGLKLRHASTVLNQGLEHACSSDQAQQTLHELYDAMVAIARSGAGISGTVVAVVEPFAKTILENTASISVCVTSKWSELVRLMGSLPQKDTLLLKALEPLLIAGFISPHKGIVNETVLFWNTTFGANNGLDYPQQLAKVLRARAAETEIVLPGFAEDESESEEMLLPAFYETQAQNVGADARPRTSESNVTKVIDRVPATLHVHRSAHFASRESPRAARLRPSSTMKASRSRQPTPRSRLRHDDSQIEFAPVESSPVPPTAESQLTEHQREVRTKQQSNAQMFPDLSSSPVVRSSAPFAGITKRLDFAPRLNHQHAGTPKKLHDAGAQMSDDITSSPTPSSNKDMDSAHMAVDEDEMTEDENAQDPPSSPPPQPEAPPQVTSSLDRHTHSSMDPAEGVEEPSNDLPEVIRTGDHDDDLDDAPRRGVPNSDLPSDTLLPNEQLQLETEQAANESKLGDTTEGTTFFVPQVKSSGSPCSEDAQDDHSADTSQVPSNALPEITRIEESFVHLPAPTDDDPEEREPGSHQSQRSARKRKRSSEVVRATKKRKQHSPLKAITCFFSSFVGGSQKQQDEDDADMEEEIVVVHSVHSPSSAKKEDARKVISPVVAVPLPPVERAVIAPSETDSQAPESQSKSRRRRGRARKSETPTSVPSPSQSGQPQTLKRKASQLDDSTVADEPVTCFVKDTPAPAKMRKQREGPDSQLVKEARLSQEATDLGRSTRRSIALSSQPNQVEEEADDAVDTENAVNEQQAPLQRQLSREVASSSNERVIASPRSILGRLKDVLSDLPRMILGPQEEREMDDVLFEIRREVHEASRRGRQ
ncbi:hypothetical protein B0A55_03516 [Friedmanniomyces simplex]|uniref:Telomere-associated protein Rif1 N-terminal domain-containing protein n=1 Tax=Friedmanniomyces simplex TaxID=329884 RepID=A0A4U0XWD3_9PEZI|nr:hypothetical protein B0A55_03516 [Friedmanniomyces simplex]